MFKEFAQIGQMLNHARQLSGRMGDVQSKLAETRVTATSFDGRVTVEFTGQGHLIRCEVNPQLLEPSAKPALEQSIIEAVNKGQNLVREAAMKEMSAAAGGLDLSSLAGSLPGFGGQ